MKLRVVMVVIAVLLVSTVVIQSQGLDKGPFSIDANSRFVKRSPAEKALEMILAGNQSRFLDGFINPDEYIIGPGDEFLISFNSDNRSDIGCALNANGLLFIKSVGVVKLGYISLREALSKITAAVKENYQGLKFTVQLHRFRFTRVNVIGEVKKPGIYYAPATWRVSEVIELAGGLTEKASHRHIRLTGYEQARSVDLTSFRKLGDNSANPLICSGNTIIVPVRNPFSGMVTVSGHVQTPGVFEFVASDAISDYVRYCEGLDRSADALELVVYTTNGDLVLQIDTDELPNSNYHPEAGDNIVVRWKDGKKQYGYVTITGAVARPGKYELTGATNTLADILKSCGGITAQGCRERIQIYRLALANDNSKAMSNGYLANMAGATADKPSQYLISYSPRFGSRPDNMVLVNKDSVFVPSKTGIISVQGAVAFPGLVRFTQGKRAKYYIDLAGGYGFDADQKRSVVINPVTGGAVGAAKAGVLFDGEILYVPRKENQSK